MKSEAEKYIQVGFGITRAHKKMVKGGSDWGSMSFNLRKILDEYPYLKEEIKSWEKYEKIIENAYTDLQEENERLKEELREEKAYAKSLEPEIVEDEEK